MKTVSVSPHSAPDAKPAGRLMVDAPTRVFHWLLALSLMGAYATSDSEHWRLIHITLGYTTLGLVAFRLLWAVIGPRPARWQTWRSRILAARAQWLPGCGGESKAAGKLVALNTMAILALILSAMLTVASGIGVDQAWWGEALEEVHEVVGNSVLLLVSLHVALVVLAARLKAGLAWRAMLTGRVSGRGPDLVSAPRRWLAAALLVVVAGFWLWQWQTAPISQPGLDGSHERHGRDAGDHRETHHGVHHRDDDDEEDD